MLDAQRKSGSGPSFSRFKRRAGKFGTRGSVERKSARNRRNNVNENGNNGDIKDDDEDDKSNVIGEIARPAQMAAVPDLLKFVASIERQEGFGDDRIKEIETALREALVIIVESAKKETSGDIVVTCKHDHWGKFVIVISDTGEPFNILLADVVFFGEKSPVDEGRRDSARLIKRMIDNIEQKRADETNILTFTVSPRLRVKQ